MHFHHWLARGRISPLRKWRSRNGNLEVRMWGSTVYLNKDVVFHIWHMWEIFLQSWLFFESQVWKHYSFKYRRTYNFAHESDSVGFVRFISGCSQAREPAQILKLLQYLNVISTIVSIIIVISKLSDAARKSQHFR